MNKKIAIVNYSGNCGKTSTARYLIAPRLNANIISIESINSDGLETNEMLGKEFTDLMISMSLMDSVVVDVGGSNVKDFFFKMKTHRGSFEDFDLFVIPVIPERKIINDAIKTIKTLSEFGVSASNIKVVLNKVDEDMKIKKEFSDIFSHYDETKSFVIVSKPISDNEIYSLLNKSKKSIEDVLSDKRDFKELLKAAKTDKDKIAMTHNLAIKRMASYAKDELDLVFSELVA